MIFAFVIWSLCALLFVVIGISSWKSKEAVGFFTGVKPPVVKDVKGYNRAVAKLWFVTATGFELLGIPFLFLEQNSVLAIPIIFGVVLGLIVMAIVYLRIEAKYKKQ